MLRSYLPAQHAIMYCAWFLAMEYLHVFIYIIHIENSCTQAIMYSGTIHKMLLQNSTAGVSREGDGLRVVKLKQGTRALVTRTLNPEVDDNSAVMVVKEVCKSVVQHCVFTICLKIDAVTNQKSL